MNNTLGMRCCNSVCSFERIPQRLMYWQQTFLEYFRQSYANDVFHDQICETIHLSDIVQAANVWMVERRNGVGFALETVVEIGALREFRANHLKGNGSAQSSIAGAKHVAHSACAKRRLDPVRTELCARM